MQHLRSSATLIGLLVTLGSLAPGAGATPVQAGEPVLVSEAAPPAATANAPGTADLEHLYPSEPGTSDALPPAARERTIVARVPEPASLLLLLSGLLAFAYARSRTDERREDHAPREAKRGVDGNRRAA